jgi:mannose-6-phosphate isomerase-like protein (cupin superfamily)
VNSADTCARREQGGCKRAPLGANRQLSVAELDVAAGFEKPTGAQAEAVESFFVLAGELEFTFDGRRVRAGRRTWLSAPPGARYGLQVVGPDSARLLHVSAPAPLA